MKSNKIYIFEHHSQLLELWRKKDFKDLHLLHLDAHCDLRGLLINRKENKAYRIGIKNSIDDGNFLAQALFEGRIRSVRWVHDCWSGRENDIFTVKYETDLFGFLYQLIGSLFRSRGLPIEYEVIKYEDWQELNEKEHLDIDWDIFANKKKSKRDLTKDCERFLNRDFKFIPQNTYIAYSPRYSYPSRPEFEYFVNCLAKKFDAMIIEDNARD